MKGRTSAEKMLGRFLVLEISGILFPDNCLTGIIKHATIAINILLEIDKFSLDCNRQRGDMERIRVNTEELKDKSKLFESSAGVFSQAGKEIMTFVAGLPSYDGQLSGPARAAALEINRQCQDVHNCLMDDSTSLTKTAQAFEDVDNQSISTFMDNLEAIGDAPLINPGGKGKGLAIIRPPEDWGDQGPIITTRTEWDGSITVITIDERHLPDGSIITKYIQTNTKVFSETDVNLLKTRDFILDAVLDAIAAFLLSGPGLLKWGLEFLGITGILNIFKIWSNSGDHDLPALEPGDKRVITTIGDMVTAPDGSTSIVWTTTIEIYSADGTLKGKLTGNYK